MIPANALHQHIAVVGKTGSGKTFAAKAAIVEPLLELHRRVGIVDPTGAWWGLRSSRDGRGPGFPILVMGGDHSDLPLPANGGAAVARLLTEQGVSLVADTSQLTMGENARWFIDFATQLYRSNSQPLHLVIDEAHNYAPQGKVPDPDTGKMLHAANKLASGGRSRGIRLVMITQRPQKLHKDTLTSADTLVAMRVLAPHDRAAIEDWIKGCGDPAQGKEVLNSLASLQRGEGWVWYPEGSHLARAKFPAIKTFDSSATPSDGHAVATPKGSAQVDLTEIRSALEAAVKEAEANDPKLLRQQIARLQTELAKKPAGEIDQNALDIAREQGREEGRREGERAGYYTGLKAVEPIANRIATLAAGITDTVTGYQEDLQRLAKAPPPKPAARPAAPPAPPAPERSTGTSAGVSGPQQRILDALAWLEAVNVEDAQRTQLALLADASPKSSSYANNLGTLRAMQLIDYRAGQRVVLTENGRRNAFPPARPPTTGDLHRTLQSRLSAPQWKILEQLIPMYPESLSKGELAKAAGASAESSSFANNLGTLRSLGFIDYPTPGQVVALPALFIQGR